jgi:arsenate reductase
MTTIYHNPRCGKSRDTLKILQEKGENVNVIEYLKDCPDYNKVKELVTMLGIPPIGLIRKGEKVFKEQYKGKEMSESDWIQAMVDYPILIERPIVIKNHNAVIGRPPEKVDEIL